MKVTDGHLMAASTEHQAAGFEIRMVATTQAVCSCGWKSKPSNREQDTLGDLRRHRERQTPQVPRLVEFT